MRGAGWGGGAPPARAGTEPGGPGPRGGGRAREGLIRGPGDASPPRALPAHARATARLGARRARAREKRWAGPARGGASPPGANARALARGHSPALPGAPASDSRAPARAPRPAPGTRESGASACVLVGLHRLRARAGRRGGSGRGLLARRPESRYSRVMGRDLQTWASLCYAERRAREDPGVPIAALYSDLQEDPSPDL